MPIYLDAERVEPGDGVAQLALIARQPVPPAADLPDGEAHRVRVVEVIDRDGSEFFVVCACGFVSLPSVWRPQHVGPAACEVAELLRRIARNRAILVRALAAEGESAIHA